MVGKHGTSSNLSCFFFFKVKLRSLAQKRFLKKITWNKVITIIDVVLSFGFIYFNDSVLRIPKVLSNTNIYKI